MKNPIFLTALFLLSCSQVNSNVNDSKMEYKQYYQQFGQLSQIWNTADYFLEKENMHALEAMPPNPKIVLPKCVSELVAKWESKNSKNVVIECPKDITGKNWDILVKTRKVGIVDWSIEK